MTQEDKQLLLTDLCARLPYGVKITDGLHITTLKVRIDTAPATLAQFIHSENLRYYLRPMSSMTEEEKKEYQSLCEIHIEHDADDNVTYYYFDTVESFDWLNKKMFDYRGLTPKGLALSTEEFNPYKN